MRSLTGPSKHLSAIWSETRDIGDQQPQGDDDSPAHQYWPANVPGILESRFSILNIESETTERWTENGRRGRSLSGRSTASHTLRRTMNLSGSDQCAE